MKRVSFLALILSVLAMGTGCLKDKDFEDQKYGIQGKEIKGVAFPQAAAGLSIAFTSQAAALNVDGPIITLEQNGTSNSDVTVTLQLNNALATAEGLTAMPTGTVTVPTTVTIPAGQSSVTIPVTLLNSNTLNPSIGYGIGLSIVGVSAGYQLARNSKDIVVAFSIKNPYDGVYSVVSGKVTRYSAPGAPLNDALSGDLTGNPDVHLVTSGPNAVVIPIPGVEGALHWSAASGSQVAGIDGVKVTIDPATNLVTMSSAGNATLANWTGTAPGITYNRYDPATKTFYLAFKWNPTANVREYEIVLKYKGPRP